MKALLYLTYRQIINSVKYTARSGKRLVPVILIVFFVAQSVVFNTLGLGYERRNVQPTMPLNLTPDLVWFIVFNLLALLVIKILYSAFSEGQLVFTPAYIDFLFPSPVNRRCILALKLIDDFFKHSLYVGFLFIFIFPSIYRMFNRVPGVSMWISFFATLLLITLTMNVTNILTIVASAGMRRFAMTKGIFRGFLLVLLIGIIVMAGIHYMRDGNILLSIVEASKSGFVRVILAPITWCTKIIVDPMLQPSVQTPWHQILWLAILAVVSFLALLARKENIYEPSLAISARMARINAAKKSGNMSQVFMEMRRGKGRDSGYTSWVPPIGTGAWALLWKMMVMSTRTTKWTYALFFLPPIAAVIASKALAGSSALVYSSVAIPYVGWYLTMAVGYQGLISEFKHGEIIKTLPDTGKTIVAVQVFSRWLPIFAFVIISMCSIAIFMPSTNMHLLGVLSIATLTGTFTCISMCAITAMLYPTSRDKLAMTVPGCINGFLNMAVIVPTAIIAAVAAHLHSSLIGTAIWLLAVNLIISWITLYIAGKAFANADPNE
jgi:hypothetical protein